MSTIAVSSGLSVWSDFDRNLDVRSVFRRVEFVLDGQSLSRILRHAGDTVPPESYVTVYEIDPGRASEVLQGRRLFEEWLPDPTRIPILMCPCGDLYCGALTTQLASDHGLVRWTNWAWDNYYEDPIQGLAAVPTFEFDASEYASALAEAASQAREGGEVLTRVRVRLPRHSWRSPLKFGFERTDPRAMLERLDVELVESRLDKPDQAALLELLTRLRWAREAIASGVAGTGSTSGRERGEVAQVLSDIVNSPQCVSLPGRTLASVKWHRDRLTHPS